RSTADYMGMLGTIINALALQSAIEKTGLECRVMSAIEVKAVSEPYIKKRAISHMEKGRVVIFGGGTGNPFFTTDTTATLRAIEVEADAILMAKNGVDGVYDDDPRTNKDANFIPEITFGELLTRNLQVMDQTAVSMIQYEDIIVHVFNMNDTSNFLRVLNGEKIGTIVKKG
ncbi:MAG TPA: uridine monophosphate kinase, partial [Bacilli bacterium]|nr:uridine monophosphate kinase [Bacilli bacterium]